MKRKMWWLKRSSSPHLCARFLMLFCTVGFILLPTSYVWANPAGEAVVGGAATFQRDGNTLTVNQATDRLAVNWQSFNIAAGERTHFNMPSSTSAALNRVIGGNPSSIYGSLSANGILYLINPSGILVGPGGTVNAAAFMASTLDVSTEQFMNAKNGAGMNFYGSSGESIINQGNITAEKGDVFLVAQKVENRGTINAANGTAGMVGSGQGTDVMVHEVGGKGFAIRVAQLQGEAATGSNRDLPDGEELLNEGSINAAQAELNASGNVYALAIRNSGTIRAKAVVANADGTVRLDGGLGDVINTGKMYAKNAGDDATAAGGKIDVAGQNITASPESIITAAGGEQGGNGGSVKIDSQDTAIVQGKVDVTAPSANAKGGKIQLLGERVGLFDGAKVDASGGAGGGTVLVGGDYLGGQTPKPELVALAKQEAEPVKNAKATVMAETAEIKADGTVNGDGGKIILWSDEYTGFYGDLFARGGVEGGNGGFIETSSKNNLQAMGSVMVGSASGNRGLWLLDPYDVTISAAATAGGAPSPVVAGSTWIPNAAGSNILNTEINTALNTGSVTVTTTSSVGSDAGDITVLGAISSAGSAGGSLIFLADGGITLNSSISIGVANLTLNATSGNIETNANITTTTGNVTLTTSAGDMQTNGDIQTSTGDVTFTSAGKIDVNGDIDTTGAAGDVTLRASGGDIALNGTITTLASQVTLNANDANIVLNSGITSDGNVNLNGNAITLDGGIDVSNATGANVGGVTIDADGAVSGSGTISLAQFYDPTAAAPDAIDGGLVIRSTGGGVEVFIDIPVSFDTSSASAVWNSLLAGPPIAVDATGAVTLTNQGLAGSTLTVGTFGGTGGITSTGAVNLAAGAGNLILGRGNVTVSGASFSGSSGETTSGIIFAGTSSRLSPAVNTTGRQTYAGVVTLNTGGLTVLSGAGMDFNGTINDGSINTTFSGTTSGGVAVTKHILPTGSESLLLLNTGLTRLQGLVGTALVPATTTPAVNDPYLSLGPLANFGQDGGTVEFLATGTAPAPAINGAGLALNGSTTGPSLYTTGSLSFGLAAKILLTANTYLTAFKDIYFGGTVDTSTGPNAPYIFNVTTFDDSLTPGTTIGGGQIIFDDAIGATGPLGALIVTAAGTDGNGKGAQININAGATTFTGTNPIPDGGNGAIILTADGAVILAGTIETNSSGTIGGGLSIISDFNGYSSVTDNKNIQIGATINTQGGAIDFLSPVFFTAASTLDTTVGNSGGAITFNGTTDGSAQATMNSGTAGISFLGNLGLQSNFNLAILGAGGVAFGADGVAISVLLGSGANTINSLAGDVVFGYPPTLSPPDPSTPSTLDIRNAGILTMNLGNNSVGFYGAVGSTNPFGMTVSSAGGVTFSEAVRMGGAFTFNQLSGPFLASSSISGAFGLTINPVNSGATLTFQEVGTKIVGDVETLVPVASLTIGNGNSAVFLNGNITTSGGVINFGSPVTANESIVLNTTGRGAVGGGISFLNAVRAGVDEGIENFTITAGRGGLTFGDAISGFDEFIVYSAGSMDFTSNGSVSAGVITLNTDVAAQADVLLSTTRGDLTIVGGLSARPSDSSGVGAKATLNSAGGISISGLVNVSGRSGTFVIFSPDGSSSTTVGTVGFKGGEVDFTAVSDISIGSLNANGGNNFVTGGDGGDGGIITLTSGGKIETSSIQANGGSDGGSGGKGGTVNLVRNAAAGDFSVSTISAVGGDGDDIGGDGGNITLTAGSGDLRAPISYLNQGGEATTGNADTIDLFSGDGGTVELNATAGSVYFQAQSLTLQGNSSLSISAGTSVVLATDLTSRTGGVVITANEGALKDVPRGSIEVKYGSGEFYMPSSAYFLTQGGDAKIYSTTGGSGTVTISGINTSGADLNGGSINIHQEAGSVLSAVNVLGALETAGATPVLPSYGRQGGSIKISGTAVSVNQINTRGSASLATANAPAFGGAGGDVSITGTTITIISGTSSTGTAVSIDTSGGTGLGVSNATGGAGGSISLNGNVILNSGDSTRTTVILNTQGGAFAGGASNGVGGNIVVTGSLTGTETTSNTLDLRYGSGTVTLGNGLPTPASDAITLGTLITAADDARSTGSLNIQGAIDLNTLTTYSRGYSLSILGGGTIENRVTFLNSGTVTIGASDVTTTFTDGFNALDGNGTIAPSTLQLGGTINTVTATSGSMLAGTTVLIADTTLNSAGNIIEFGGTLDGSFNLILTLASGLTGGTANFNGAVGDTTQVGQIRINGGVDSVNITRGNFLSTVKAIGITSLANSSLTFNKDVTLSGGVAGAVDTNLGGTVTFNNVSYPDDLTAVLSFLGAGANTFSGAITLEGGPINFGGDGAYTFNGAVTGSQNMILAGGGAKIFNGTVSVGSELLGITQADEAGNTVRFNNTVTTAGVSTFNRGVTLGAMTFNSGGATTMNAAVTIAGAATLQGAGGYQLNGAVDGASSLTLSGAGAKTFSGAVGTGTALTTITQANDSGLVTFAENVTMSGAGAFSANLVLDGMVFTAGGVTTMNGVTLSSGLVTLAGAGNYTVNGAMTGSQVLTLNDAGTKTFASTANIAGFTQVDGTGIATFQGNVTTSGASTFNSLVTLSGMTFSAGGLTILGDAAGDTITLNTGMVTLGGSGAYISNGVMTGAQTLTLAGNNSKTFNSTVTVGNGTSAMAQANRAGNSAIFAENLFLNGASSFAQQVTLDGMTVTASGATGLNTVVLSGGAVTLQGPGGYTTTGAVSGAQNFTLSGSGIKTFASTINSANLTQTGGQVKLGGNVTTTGLVDLENAATTASLTVASGVSTQTYDALTLGGNLTANTTSTINYAVVNGSGNMTTTAQTISVTPTTVRNQGTFTAIRSGGGDIVVGTGGNFMDAVSLGAVRSTGGMVVQTTGQIDAASFTAGTSITLDSSAGDVNVANVVVPGNLRVVTGGINAANFSGSSSASSFALDAGTVNALSSSILDIPSLGNIRLRNPGQTFSYSTGGNFTVTGQVNVGGTGNVIINPAGIFVNSYSGNPFTANSTKIITKDLFSNDWPSNGAVPGLQVVYGVNNIGQLGANQIGASTSLLAGNAGPFILEFTTGTGQPYILAQQTAIPPVMLPAALTGGNGFARSVTYSADEIEMMTPEERSAYENQQRQVSARVILQGQSGVGEEIGAPTEGRTPQAATPAALAPVAPTAQVLLEGKPLAGAKSDQERGDATKIIKLRPTRAVALRPSYRAADVMESERMAAEVSVGAAPVAQSR